MTPQAAGIALASCAVAVYLAVAARVLSGGTLSPELVVLAIAVCAALAARGLRMVTRAQAANA